MPLLRPSRRAELPDGLHLLAAILGAHVIVIEDIPISAPLLRFARPEKDLGGVGECASAQVGWWIRLFPDNVIQNAKAILSQRHPDARVNVQRTRDPDRARRSEDSKCLCCPGQMELVVGL